MYFQVSCQLPLAGLRGLEIERLSLKYSRDWREDKRCCKNNIVHRQDRSGGKNSGKTPLHLSNIRIIEKESVSRPGGCSGRGGARPENMQGMTLVKLTLHCSIEKVDLMFC